MASLGGEFTDDRSSGFSEQGEENLQQVSSVIIRQHTRLLYIGFASWAIDP